MDPGSRSVSVNVNGVNLACDLHGSGEPILLIHGFPLSGRLWNAVVEPMRDAWRLIIPDLRGMGRSQATTDATMATYADDLAALLDALGESRPAVVVGLSMGGYIAFEFHRRHLERVRALVLTDTRAEADTPQKTDDRAAMADRVLSEGSRIVAEAMLPGLFGPKAPVELKEEWNEIICRTPPLGTAAALRAMAQRPDSTATLADIRVPTLVVVGEDDALTPPADARTLHRGIVGAQLRLIPDAGHMAPVEQPGQFVRVLQRFVDSL